MKHTCFCLFQSYKALGANVSAFCRTAKHWARMFGSFSSLQNIERRFFSLLQVCKTAKHSCFAIFGYLLKYYLYESTNVSNSLWAFFNASLLPQDCIVWHLNNCYTIQLFSSRMAEKQSIFKYKITSYLFYCLSVLSLCIRKT